MRDRCGLVHWDGDSGARAAWGHPPDQSMVDSCMDGLPVPGVVGVEDDEVFALGAEEDALAAGAKPAGVRSEELGAAAFC